VEEIDRSIKNVFKVETLEMREYIYIYIHTQPSNEDKIQDPTQNLVDARRVVIKD